MLTRLQDTRQGQAKQGQDLRRQDQDQGQGFAKAKDFDFKAKAKAKSTTADTLIPFQNGKKVELIISATL